MRQPRSAAKDERVIRELRRIIHETAFVGSTVGLTALSYMRARRSGYSGDEAHELKFLHISRLISLLGSDIAISRWGSGERAPRLFTSRLRFSDPESAVTQQRRRLIGPPSNRDAVGRALEKSLSVTLQNRLPAGFIVKWVGSKEHGTSNDILIFGPNGFVANLEVKNHRSHVLDTFNPAEMNEMVRDRDLGRHMFRVIPACTTRARNIASDVGTGMIETDLYITATPLDRDLWVEHGWGAWPTKTAHDGVPLIADQVVRAVLEAAALSLGETTTEVTVLAECRSERHESTVSASLRLHREGIPTAARAASILGMWPSAISNAFRRAGIESPWHGGLGGARAGSGRKPNSQKELPPTT